jgi:nucleotide-binding universal stress UspA family protein
MFQRILVPLDGSRGAERAIPVAAHLARSTSGSIVLLHVIAPSVLVANGPGEPPHTQRGREREEQALIDASDYLAAAIAAYREELAGIPTEMDVTFGLTPPTVSSTARLEHGDAIVMCSHREADLGHWGRESITLQTMHCSPVPLLILGEHGMVPLPDAAHPLRILVPLDGSLFAESALEPARHMLRQFSDAAPCEIRLIRMVRNGAAEYAEAERYLKTIANRLRTGSSDEGACSITAVVVVGINVAEAVREQTREESHAHLITLATHCREGMQRLALGSIAEELLETTTYPLLLVHPWQETTRTTQSGQRAVGKR